MKLSVIIPGLLALTFTAAQGVTDPVAPDGDAPKGCQPSYDGPFQITVVQVQDVKRGVFPQKRSTAACGAEGILVMTLKNGITIDSLGRTGYIASNEQFQFDNPPQAGAKYTSGFSMCDNNVLALGSSKTFYRCLSGDFYNLYDKNWAAQCEPVHIIAMPCGSPNPVSQIPDGQIIGTSVLPTTYVSTLPDGQPQVITTTVPIPLCQIGDGQIQAHTTPCASLPTTSYVPVSQYTDGQIQVTPPGPPPYMTTATGLTPPAGNPPASTGVAPPQSAPVDNSAPPPPPGTLAPSPGGSPPPAGTGAGPAPPASSPTGAQSTPAGPVSMTRSATQSAATSKQTTTPSTPGSTSAPPTEGGSSPVSAASFGGLVVGLLMSLVFL